MRLRAFISIVVVVSAALFVYACGDDDTVACGDASTQVGSRCVDEDSGSSHPNAGSGGSKPPTGGSLSCGEGTVARNGKCVVVDGGSITPPPAPSPVGSGCKSNDDCADGTTCLIDAKLPGGLCTVQGCDMTHPCPVGSTCNRVTKGFNICFPFCDTDVGCRKDEGYVCQPLLTNAINICAPPCTISKGCPSGTDCNEKNGLCELAECDPNAATSVCHDNQTCWPDTKLSTKGGLCLVMCDPNNPKATCKVDEKDEVCQPLAEDPANTGFCAPPVCSKTSECPAGATCQDMVCQPPALADSNGDCDDNSTTSVGGACMPKCPTGSGEACSDIHPGLVCASVLDVPACLPLGSFPGSECRPDRDDACSDLAVGDDSAPMLCEDNTCLVDCTTGGQELCTAINADLICAAGIFDHPLCLPKGAFPGGPCGANDSCAQDLQGNPAIDMKCVSDTCLIDCDESTHWRGYGDALCSITDPSLTCATAAGSICVRACSSTGACDTDFSCLDAGAVGTHENACLPTGSFPGSPCATGNTCADISGGLTQSCVGGTCVVNCGAGATAQADDQICAAVDASLTCSESAGDICVRKCNGGTCADAGFSCLNPGTENACLPTGSFPGSPCRAGADKCDLNLGGNAAVDMKCVANTCVVDCNTAGTAAMDDGLCSAVSSVLTCSETARDICVVHCVAGNCLPGFSCLDPTGENACLPTGSYPGSPCRATVGNECDQNLGGDNAVDMECVGGTCVIPCGTPGDAAADDAHCAAIDDRLTCSETAENLCVFACDDGECPTGYSCFGEGGENACLPNGSFPGSTCRTTVGDECDLNLGGIPDFDMQCVDTTCVLGCNTVGPAAMDDGLCEAFAAGNGLDFDLTCSESAQDICVPSCETDPCPTGFSCLDQAGEHACLPTGSFPGSACRPTSGDECDDVTSGAGTTPQSCVQGTCVATCPGNVDATCTNIDASLTCSQAAGNLCVLKCNAGACIQPGYSCFDPTGQAECLPNGSFPGSACATGNTCGAGPLGSTMRCSTNSGPGTCLVNCAGASGDTLCSTISAALTCSDVVAACLPACNVAYGASKCPPTLSCLSTENACLPNGSFPGSACATGNTCGAGPLGSTMTCSTNSGPGTCVVNCAAGAPGDTLCSTISAALTCSDAGGGFCLPACNAAYGVTKCPPTLSCLPTENACLPDGTFPGSACAGGTTCSPVPKISGGTTAQACTGGKCAVSCAANDDPLCADVSPALTCFDTPDLCVVQCVQGQCPAGFTCNTGFPADGDICLPTP